MADSLIELSVGNPRVLEALLGFDKFDLGKNPFRIDFTEIPNLRFSNGTERSANKYWLAGGYTSGNIPEARISSTHKFKFSEIKML